MELEPVRSEGEDPGAAVGKRGIARTGRHAERSPAPRRAQVDDDRVEGLPETDAAENLATAPPVMKRD
jgi:hypothetical protein